MEIQPIFAAMRRNKFGAILICVQMAVTVAVLCNAIFVIQQRLAWTQRVTGIDDESSVFAMRNKWIGNPAEASARTRRDLDALRSIPGVEDAYVTNSFPLSGGGSSGTISLKEFSPPAAYTSFYFVDEHALRTLGLRLVAGRNFTASEVIDPFFTVKDMPQTSVGVIVSAALAHALFPNESALGKRIFVGLPKPVTIIGVVEHLEGPFLRATGWGSAFTENTVLSPVKWGVPEALYVIRARQGQVEAVMRDVQRVLIKLDRSRILAHVQSIGDSRKEAFRDDRAFVLVLVTVCVVLVAVTALGIVGLTSYWVSQRRRQIGIRRALGGTRLAILRYFQTENLVIAMVAAVLGCALTVAFNLWAVNKFEMARLPYYYLAIGAGIILLLGQLSAIWPALRASLVPPALAARGT
jgi:putative ABC transport system permease protein